MYTSVLKMLMAKICPISVITIDNTHMIFTEDIFGLNRQLIVSILDIYAMHTGLTVALYEEKTGIIIWSKKSEVSSPLCRFLENDPQHMCAEDHHKRCNNAKGIIEQCHAGLWNLAMPVTVQGKKVATLMSGQVRLKNKKKAEESEVTLDSFLKNNNIKDKHKIKDLFYETKEIDEIDFNTLLMNELANIQEYIYQLIYHRIRENAAKREKVQNLSHDFLLTLQAMLCKAEVLKNEVERSIDNKKVVEYADEVLKETLKLTCFTKNMIGSMMPELKTKHQFTSVNTFDLLNECVSLFQNEALRKRVIIYPPKIICTGKDTENLTFPIIEALEEELKRVFINIIQNAVKYSFTGTSSRNRHISIICHNVTNEFIVEIDNYGTGILKEEIKNEKIFNDGYRGKLASDRNRTGSGIGLYEANRIIKRHNGNIKVKSEKHENAYKTTFFIYLPLKQKNN